MVINYGSMSPGSITAQNLGWVAQREVTFTVPLEQWEMDDGRLVFKKWACVSPFIFVDDELSLTTGREVYGWPKAYAHMETLPTLWSQDPRLESRLFIMRTEITARPYLGEQERPLVLMEVDLAARPTYSEFPPSSKNPWSPIAILSTAAEGSMRLMQDMTDIILGLPIRGYRSDRDPATLLRMTRKIGGTMLDVLPPFLRPLNYSQSTSQKQAELAIDQITLKQFRDAASPEKACYQAIVSSRMGINRLNSCGLLGDLYLLRGDPSGGFTIRLHRYTAQPIIESLGLEIDSTEESAKDDGSVRSGPRNSASVALIKPTFPFWTDVDLRYDKGKVLCLRSDSQSAPVDDKDKKPRWINPINPEAQTTTVRGRKKDNVSKAIPSRLTDLPDYNTTQGLAVQPVTGPFRFPDLTLQVYPLLADRTKLNTYIDGYLNKPLKGTGLIFESFGTYAYLVIGVCSKQYGTMWSETNNLGWWADKDVSFCVPVKVYQQKGEKKKELISLALIAPFAYANSGRAVITDREVNGRHASKANITCPPDAWLGPRGPCSDRHMLQLETQVFPALNVGQRSEMRTLLEITAEDPAKSEDIRNRLIAETWDPRVFDEEARLNEDPGVPYLKDAKNLVPELLTRANPFNFIYLKQYRDAEDHDSVCYQAYVNAVKRVHSVMEMARINERVYIRLHKYPDHNVRDALGLSCVRMDSEGDSVVYVLEPINAFWLRAQVNEELSKVLCSRVTNKGVGWKSNHSWFHPASEVQWSNQKHREEPYFRSEYGYSASGRLEDEMFPTDSSSLWDEQTKAASDTLLWKALNGDLNRIDRKIQELKKQQKRLVGDKGKRKGSGNQTFDDFVGRLSDETASELKRAGWETKLVASKRSIDDLYWLVEELVYALKGQIVFAEHEKKHERLKRHDARVAIEEFDDVMTLLKRLRHEGIGRPRGDEDAK
jgi:hypothetical protein